MNNPALFLTAAAHEMKGLNLKDQHKQNAAISIPSFFPIVWTQYFLTDRGNEWGLKTLF